MKNKTYLCHDCGKKIETKGEEITNGRLLKYAEDTGREHFILKCNGCFEKNPSLNNYQQCEVYSRVVGYLRPVQQWHASKQEEFKERKNFKINFAK